MSAAGGLKVRLERPHDVLAQIAKPRADAAQSGARVVLDAAVLRERSAQQVGERLRRRKVGEGGGEIGGGLPDAAAIAGEAGRRVEQGDHGGELACRPRTEPGTRTASRVGRTSGMISQGVVPASASAARPCRVSSSARVIASRSWVGRRPSARSRPIGVCVSRAKRARTWAHSTPPSPAAIRTCAAVSAPSYNVANALHVRSALGLPWCRALPQL